MVFKDEEKQEILKVFTNFIKSIKGKGPRNIYIKLFEDEFHVVMQGVVSDYEKHFIKNFGDEIIGILTDFYERDAFFNEEQILENLNYKYNLKFYKLESDFINDLFVYKMKII